jgi:predicted nicotinamide N-methyase
MNITDGTWKYAWPAGERLLTEIAGLIDVRGRTVIDLGCGRGRLGLWAAAQGAQVTFADGCPEALAAVAQELQARGLAGTLLHHTWGEPLPHADLLLGGDILYRSALFPELVTSIASASCPGLLADPRTSLEPELAELALAAGLEWRSERRQAGYTLIRFSKRVR